MTAPSGPVVPEPVRPKASPKVIAAIFSRTCPIGSYRAHTINFEQDECIWCGPNALAWKPGEWRPIEGGQAWSATAALAVPQ